MVPANDYFTPVKLGQRVYFPIHDFIVEAHVIGLENIYSVGGTGPAIWEYSYPDHRLIISPSKPDDESIIEDKNESFWKLSKLPEGALWVNQFCDIDEPVGHTVQIDDEIFTTLKDARTFMRENYGYTKRTGKYRNNARRRHKEWRLRMKKFILGTHRYNNVHAKISWPNYGPKRIWRP